MTRFEPISQRVEAWGHAAVTAAVTVHRELGPGLLESVYEACMAHELREAGFDVRLQQTIPIRYRGQVLDNGYRADLIVEGAVLIELKTVDRLSPIHEAQILTYLRLGGFRLGFLMNFAQPTMRDGIRRFVI